MFKITALLKISTCPGNVAENGCFRFFNKKSRIAVIDNNNTLWMWGDGGDGIFGGTPVGEDSFYTTPQKVMDNVSSVSISNSSTTPYIAVIKTDGSLWTWGHNGNGQLGNGGKGKDFNGWSIFQETPLKIMDDVTAVSCGISHAVDHVLEVVVLGHGVNLHF